MFITQEDFKVVASEAALKVITQADDANADNAIQEAMEEIAGYLRPKYDCRRKRPQPTDSNVRGGYRSL